MRTRGLISAALLCCTGSIVFAQTNGVTTTSAASYAPIVAPDSIASAWGSGFAPVTTAANTTPTGGQLLTLPTTLGPVSLSFNDGGSTALKPPLYMVSPGQINFVVPANAKLGANTLSVNGSSNSSGKVLVSNVAPALLTVDSSGTGIPVGMVLRVTADGNATTDTLYQTGTQVFTAKPINLSSSADRVYLILYGTGIRRHSPNPVQAMIGGVKVPVQYAGAQSQYPGFDQVNLGPLPQTLAGKGSSDLVLTVDGVPTSGLKVTIQ